MGNRYIFPALFQGLVCVPRESYKVNCFESSNLRSLTFPSHGMQEFEMVHSHLQDLCFLQFRWSLTGKKNILLCCIRFYEAVVLISNKTFNNTHEELPASQKHWAPASWALTGCGWSGLCASSLWSMQEERDGQGRPEKQKIKIQGYNSLTPLLFFRARIWDALPGDMDPVTGLHHGDRERGRWGRCWGMALAQREAWWLWFYGILLLLPSLIWHRQDGTSDPFNLISFLGTEEHRSARERREDKIVLV